MDNLPPRATAAVQSVIYEAFTQFDEVYLRDAGDELTRMRVLRLRREVVRRVLVELAECEASIEAYLRECAENR